MENGWIENGLSGCGKWMWKVESGKWRGSGSHISYESFLDKDRLGPQMKAEIVGAVGKFTQG